MAYGVSEKPPRPPILAVMISTYFQIVLSESSRKVKWSYAVFISFDGGSNKKIVGGIVLDGRGQDRTMRDMPEVHIVQRLCTPEQ